MTKDTLYTGSFTAKYAFFWHCEEENGVFNPKSDRLLGQYRKNGLGVGVKDRVE